MKPLNYKVQRISRTYYWIGWVLCNAIGTGALLLVASEFPNDDTGQVRWIFAFIMITYLGYLFLLTKKRFHDAGKSTVYCIFCILLIPIAIGDLLIFLTCIKKSDEDNRWGPNEEKIIYERNRDCYGK